MNTPVSFEIAKLLKEKGFDELCKLCVEDGDERPLPFNCGNTIHRNSLHPYYSAPTIAEVVMWLYEKHGIWISVYSDKSLNWESLFSIKIDWIYPKDSPDAEDNNPKYFKYKGENEFISPTEAYEAAIKYTLNNLI